MTGLMTGKRGLIMGLANEKSLAWGIAQKLAEQGAELAFSYQGEAQEKRVRPLAASLGSDFLIPCDVSDMGLLDATFDAIGQRWGTLDFIVHAIGFSDKHELRGKFYDTSLDNFLLTMNVSAYSFVAVAKRARALMPDGGSLLTLTYYGAEKVIPHYNVMGVAKAALEASVKYLAMDMGPENIRVNAISAGPIQTLAARGIGDFNYIMKWNEYNSPMRRNVTIEDVGGAGLYLLSDLASGVTGEIHHVDAGYNVIGMKAEDAPDIGLDKVSYNSFGHAFRFTTWGESHGPAIGAVVDGCPPGLALSEADIQPFLDKRRPGTSKFTTQRQEPDQVRILSGVFEGKTTGTPISLMIENVDQRSKDYSEVAQSYRPGHADYAYDAKYGFRDYRGGGRSSARETASRVAAGAVARLAIPEVTILAWVSEIGGDAIDPARFDAAEIGNNPFFCPDPEAAKRWETLVDAARLAGSSLGAVVECAATGVPAGWGAPLYAKLDAELAGAMMSINAVKGVEIGDGFAAARLSGEDNADPMRPGTSGPDFLANHAGGIAGGIATGQPVRLRVAFKPTSSILTPVETITRTGEASEIRTKGRHDPCVGIRGVPVVEAMMALVLADQKLLHRAQTGR